MNMASPLVFLLLYCFFVGLLMFLNTTVFSLGDPSWGSSGWCAYWPIWMIFFLPASIVTLVALRQQSARSHGIAMVVILFLIEISFYFDVRILTIVGELVVFSVAVILLAQRLKVRS